MGETALSYAEEQVLDRSAADILSKEQGEDIDACNAIVACMYQ